MRHCHRLTLSAGPVSSARTAGRKDTGRTRHTAHGIVARRPLSHTARSAGGSVCRAAPAPSLPRQPGPRPAGARYTEVTHSNCTGVMHSINCYAAMMRCDDALLTRRHTDRTRSTLHLHTTRATRTRLARSKLMTAAMVFSERYDYPALMALMASLLSLAMSSDGAAQLSQPRPLRRLAPLSGGLAPRLPTQGPALTRPEPHEALIARTAASPSSTTTASSPSSTTTGRLRCAGGGEGCLRCAASAVSRTEPPLKATRSRSLKAQRGPYRRAWCSGRLPGKQSRRLIV